MTDTEAELGFEQILAELESIAAQLERGDVKLEDALHLFERGVRLSREGSRRLDDAEHKIEVLLENGETTTPADVSAQTDE